MHAGNFLSYIKHLFGKQKLLEICTERSRREDHRTVSIRTVNVVTRSVDSTTQITRISIRTSTVYGGKSNGFRIVVRTG